MDHNVVKDSAGWGGHTRLTCYSCQGATLIWQPYMNDDKWRAALREFNQAHPSEVGRRAAHRELSFSPFPGCINVMNAIGRTDLVTPDGRKVMISVVGMPGQFLIQIEGDTPYQTDANLNASAYLNNHQVGTNDS